MEKSPLRSNSDIKRFARQIILPQIGFEGQQKLKNSSVLVVGAGGLGSPVVMYLTAAGIGRLGIVEFDVVEESNLHRQILFDSADIGRDKIVVAEEKLCRLYPNIQLEVFSDRLTPENALDILSNFDVIIDGTDNYSTRYLVNDACVLLNKPNVYGSVAQFEGRVTIFDNNNGPCYRCLYPVPPDPRYTQNCAEAGVLGVLPGMIGILQATESLKLLLGIGAPLLGRMLLYDALEMTFDEITVSKKNNCPVCGDNPTITKLINYDVFCKGQKKDPKSTFYDGKKSDNKNSKSSLDKKELSVAEFMSLRKKKEKVIVLDVRDLSKGPIVGMDNVINIPFMEIPDRIFELDKNSHVVVVCRIGEQSRTVVKYLLSNGFPFVYNLTGGLTKWAQEYNSSLPGIK